LVATQVAEAAALQNVAAEEEDVDVRVHIDSSMVDNRG